MSNEVLNSLLKEYEQKKLKAEMDLDKRKSDLYNKIPELQKIEDELNKLSLETAKNLLNKKGSFSDFEKKVEELKYRKACILQDANIPSNYLKPYYDCLICNDTGYVTNENYKTEMCSCLKQKLLDISFNKSNMSNLDKENFDNPQYKNLLFTGNTGLR